MTTEADGPTSHCSDCACESLAARIVPDSPTALPQSPSVAATIAKRKTPTGLLTRGGHDEWTEPGSNRRPKDFQASNCWPRSAQKTLELQVFYHVHPHLQALRNRAENHEDLRNICAFCGRSAEESNPPDCVGWG